jgi:hypothetical protein
VKLGLKRWRTEQAAAKAPKNPNGELYLALTGPRVAWHRIASHRAWSKDCSAPQNTGRRGQAESLSREQMNGVDEMGWTEARLGLKTDDEDGKTNRKLRQRSRQAKSVGINRRAEYCRTPQTARGAGTQTRDGTELS